MKDFFVSYNSADRTWAEWIAWQKVSNHESHERANFTNNPTRAIRAFVTFAFKFVSFVPS